MKRLVRITENDLIYIVKRVINEQMGGFVEVIKSLPETGQDVVGLDKLYGGANNIDYDKSINNLFYLAQRQPQGVLSNYQALDLEVI